MFSGNNSPATWLLKRGIDKICEARTSCCGSQQQQHTSPSCLLVDLTHAHTHMYTWIQKDKGKMPFTNDVHAQSCGIFGMCNLHVLGPSKDPNVISMDSLQKKIRLASCTVPPVHSSVEAAALLQTSRPNHLWDTELGCLAYRKHGGTSIVALYPFAFSCSVGNYSCNLHNRFESLHVQRLVSKCCS